MSNENSGSVPANWYTDPANSSQLRWWDGAQWTEHVREPAVAAVPAFVPVEPAFVPAIVHQPVPTHAPGYAPAEFAGVHQPSFGQHGYTPTYAQTNAYVPATPGPARAPNNRAAWWALGLGSLSALFTLSIVLHNSSSIIVSTSGVFAIINGIRALILASEGRATRRIPAILGIVLGAIGTIIMVSSFLGLFSQPSYSGGDTSTTTGVTPNQTTPDQSAPQTGTQSDPSITPLPDNAVDSYLPLTVMKQAAVAHGCTGTKKLTDPIPEPIKTSTSPTGLLGERNSMSFQLQTMSQALQNEKGTSGWPAVIYEDPNSHIVFSEDCRTLGFVPFDLTLAYAQSPDKIDVVLVIVDTPKRIAEMYRSVDRSIYNL